MRPRRKPRPTRLKLRRTRLRPRLSRQRLRGAGPKMRSVARTTRYRASKRRSRPRLQSNLQEHFETVAEGAISFRHLFSLGTRNAARRPITVPESVSSLFLIGILRGWIRGFSERGADSFAKRVVALDFVFEGAELG